MRDAELTQGDAVSTKYAPIYDELLRRCQRLEALNATLADRVAAASEVLSHVAEGGGPERAALVMIQQLAGRWAHSLANQQHGCEILAHIERLAAAALGENKETTCSPENSARK
jgi:hypothetical protein